MKVKIWKDKSGRDGWVIATFPKYGGRVEFSTARTWELAMAQARWLMQHLRSA